MDKVERVSRGKKGAEVKWANTVDRTAATSSGRSASTQRLNDRLAAERGITLDAADYDEQIARARSEHFRGLAAASAVVRGVGTPKKRGHVEGVCPACGHEALLVAFATDWEAANG